MSRLHSICLKTSGACLKTRWTRDLDFRKLRKHYGYLVKSFIIQCSHTYVSIFPFPSSSSISVPPLISLLPCTVLLVERHSYRLSSLLTSCWWLKTLSSVLRRPKSMTQRDVSGLAFLELTGLKNYLVLCAPWLATMPTLIYINFTIASLEPPRYQTSSQGGQSGIALPAVWKFLR